MKKTAIKTVGYVGKQMMFVCTVGVTDSKLDKLCLEDVVGCDISFEHVWTAHDRRFKNLGLRKGQRIEFKAMLTSYVGLEEGTANVIRKIGLENPRYIRKI